MYEGKPVEETGGETCNAMQDGHFKAGGVLRKKKKPAHQMEKGHLGQASWL